MSQSLVQSMSLAIPFIFTIPPYPPLSPILIRNAPSRAPCQGMPNHSEKNHTDKYRFRKRKKYSANKIRSSFSLSSRSEYSVLFLNGAMTSLRTCLCTRKKIRLFKGLAARKKMLPRQMISRRERVDQIDGLFFSSHPVSLCSYERIGRRFPSFVINATMSPVLYTKS